MNSKLDEIKREVLAAELKNQGPSPRCLRCADLYVLITSEVYEEDEAKAEEFARSTIAKRIADLIKIDHFLTCNEDQFYEKFVCKIWLEVSESENE